MPRARRSRATAVRARNQRVGKNTPLRVVIWSSVYQILTPAYL